MPRTTLVPYMPALLPDELLYSLLGRVVLLNKLERPQTSLRTLIGGHLAVVSLDLTARLGELHARLGRLSPGCSPQDLAEKATLFPYHRAFLPSSRASRVLEALMQEPNTHLKSTIGLCANGFGASTVLRYCSQCVREDHHKYGTGYWRRSHHLPGVSVCAHHGLSLVSGIAPSGSGNRHALRLPPWNVDQLERGPPASHGQWRFAALSACALQQRAQPTSEMRRAAAYQRMAIGMGFAGARARIDYPLLAQALQDHHAQFDGFEHRERLLSTKRNPLAWLRPLLSRPQRAMHPICHLVLIDFLFGTWGAYEDALRARDVVHASISCEVRKPPYAAASVEASQIFDQSLSCREAARRAGLCVTTVATRRRAAGVPVASRRKTVCGPVADLVRAMIMQGASPAHIAEHTGVSMTTAYRMRREHMQTVVDHRSAKAREIAEKHRHVWLGLAQMNRSVKAARNLHPSTYAWLYRNDRDWLVNANVAFAKPQRSNARVDWAVRDRCWSDRLVAYARVWREQHPRDRLSCSHLRRVVASWTLRRSPHHVPRTIDCILALSETRADFQRRRAIEAHRSFGESAPPPLLWRVLRRSGLRALPALLPSLSAPENGLLEPYDAHPLPPITPP